MFRDRRANAIMRAHAPRTFQWTQSLDDACGVEGGFDGGASGLPAGVVGKEAGGAGEVAVVKRARITQDAATGEVLEISEGVQKMRAVELLDEAGVYWGVHVGCPLKQMGVRRATTGVHAPTEKSPS